MEININVLMSFQHDSTVNFCQKSQTTANTLAAATLSQSTTYPGLTQLAYCTHLADRPYDGALVPIILGNSCNIWCDLLANCKSK